MHVSFVIPVIIMYVSHPKYVVMDTGILITGDKSAVNILEKIQFYKKWVNEFVQNHVTE